MVYSFMGVSMNIDTKLILRFGYLGARKMTLPTKMPPVQAC